MTESGTKGKKSTRVDESSNSNYKVEGKTKTALIIETLRNSPIPLTPKEIAENTHLSESTVRGYVIKLKNESKIVRISRGLYSVPENVSTLRGVGGYYVPNMSEVRLDRVHNLMFKGWVDGAARWCCNRACVVLKTDFVEVKIKGYNTGTFIVYVDCKPEYSFDLPQYQFLVAFLKRLLGPKFEDFEVVTHEFNHDFVGFRIDGAKNFTVRTLGGVLKRTYQKSESVVRVEAKAPVPLSIQQVEALLQGGDTCLQHCSKQFRLGSEYRQVRSS